MSESKLPKFAAPQYLDRKIHVLSEYELKYYFSELGLSGIVKKPTTDNDSSKLYTNKLSSTKSCTHSAWSSSNPTKIKTTRRWIRLKSSLKSCLKSVQFKFTALGILLGVAISLAALIPIVIVWKTSTSNSESSTTVSSFGIASGVELNVSTITPKCDLYFCEEQYWFTTNMTMKSLSLEVRVQRTSNITYFGTYTNYPAALNSTYVTTSTEIIFTFFIQGNQLLSAGTYECAVQFHVPGVTHTTVNDKYSLQTTNICGTVSSVSGYFS